MVRKTQFSREDVIQAAFQVVRQHGIEKLTARAVAQELGASTAPVYSNFGKMEELEKAAFAKAAEKLKEYAAQPHSDNLFLNIGIGVLRYAKDCPLWYYAFSVKQDLSKETIQGLMGHFLRQMSSVPQLASLPEQERVLLLHKMGIFTHGMAWDVCLGHIPEEALESGIHLMEEVGAALTADALARPPRSEEEYRMLAPLCHHLVTIPETLGESS